VSNLEKSSRFSVSEKTISRLKKFAVFAVAILLLTAFQSMIFESVLAEETDPDNIVAVSLSELNFEEQQKSFTGEGSQKVIEFYDTTGYDVILVGLETGSEVVSIYDGNFSEPTFDQIVTLPPNTQSYLILVISSDTSLNFSSNEIDGFTVRRIANNTDTVSINDTEFYMYGTVFYPYGYQLTGRNFTHSRYVHNRYITTIEFGNATQFANITSIPPEQDEPSPLVYLGITDDDSISNFGLLANDTLSAGIDLTNDTNSIRLMANYSNEFTLHVTQRNGTTFLDLIKGLQSIDFNASVLGTDYYDIDNVAVSTEMIIELTLSCKADVTIAHNNTVEYELYVYNTGTLPSQYKLSAEILGSTDGISMDPSTQITGKKLDPGNTALYTYSISIDEYTPPGSRDIEFTLKSMDSSTIYDNFTTEITIGQALAVDVDAELEDYEIPVNATNVFLNFTVKNRGNVNDTYNLSAINNAGFPCSINVSSVTLEPGVQASISCNVTIDPLDIPTYIRFLGRSVLDSSVKNVDYTFLDEELTISFDITALDESIQSEPDNPVVFEYVVENDGDTDDVIDIIIESPFSYALLDSNNNPLLDSDGDGFIDTGTMLSSSSNKVKLRFEVPLLTTTGLYSSTISFISTMSNDQEKFNATIDVDIVGELDLGPDGLSSSACSNESAEFVLLLTSRYNDLTTADFDIQVDPVGASPGFVVNNNTIRMEYYYNETQLDSDENGSFYIQPIQLYATTVLKLLVLIPSAALLGDSYVVWVNYTDNHTETITQLEFTITTLLTGSFEIDAEDGIECIIDGTPVIRIPNSSETNSLVEYNISLSNNKNAQDSLRLRLAQGDWQVVETKYWSGNDWTVPQNFTDCNISFDPYESRWVLITIYVPEPPELESSIDITDVRITSSLEEIKKYAELRTSVGSPGNITLIAAEGNTSVCPGSVISLEYNVYNNLSTVEIIDLFTELPDGWTYRYHDNESVILGDSNENGHRDVGPISNYSSGDNLRTITLKIWIPRDAINESYNISVKSVSGEDLTKYDIANVTVDIEETWTTLYHSYGKVAPQNLYVDYSVSLTNTLNRIANLTLSSESSDLMWPIDIYHDSSWQTFPYTVQFDPFEEMTYTIRVSIAFDASDGDTCHNVLAVKDASDNLIGKIWINTTANGAPAQLYSLSTNAECEDEGQVNFSVKLLNNLTENEQYIPDNYIVTFSGDQSLQVTVKHNGVPINSGSLVFVGPNHFETLIVEIMALGDYNDSASVQIGAEPLSNPPCAASLTLNVVIALTGEIYVNCSDPDIYGSPGQVISYTLNITNDLNTDTAIELFTNYEFASFNESDGDSLEDSNYDGNPDTDLLQKEGGSIDILLEIIVPSDINHSEDEFVFNSTGIVLDTDRSSTIDLTILFPELGFGLNQDVNVAQLETSEVLNVPLRTHKFSNSDAFVNITRTSDDEALSIEDFNATLHWLQLDSSLGNFTYNDSGYLIPDTMHGNITLVLSLSMYDTIPADTLLSFYLSAWPDDLSEQVDEAYVNFSVLPSGELLMQGADEAFGISTTVYDLHLVNDVNFEDSFELDVFSSIGISLNYSQSLNMSPIGIGESRDLELYLELPDNLEKNHPYPVDLYINYSSRSGFTAHKLIYVEKTIISLEVLDISIVDDEPGGSITVTFNITNPGSSENDVILEALNIPFGWSVTFNVSTSYNNPLILVSGSYAHVLATISIPELDFDLDGLTNIEEAHYGSSFMVPDSDSDGIWDAAEYEFWTLFLGTDEGDAAEYLIKGDVDGDGLSDGSEIIGIEFFGARYYSSPLLSDSDNDGLSDLEDLFYYAPYDRYPIQVLLSHEDLYQRNMNFSIEEAKYMFRVTCKVIYYSQNESSLSTMLSTLDTLPLEDIFINVSYETESKTIEGFEIDWIYDRDTDINDYLGLNATEYGVFIGFVNTTEDLNLSFNISVWNSCDFINLSIYPLNFHVDRRGGLTSRDYDGDGLLDGYEVIYGTNPWRKDTDGDGLCDGWFDEDHDQIYDEGFEYPGEKQYGTDPTHNDTDRDGLSDQYEVNTTYDGETAMWWKYGVYTIQDRTNPFAQDTDMDGLDDKAELDNGTNPTNPDSDGDKLYDGWELDNNFDPTDDDEDENSNLDGDDDEDGDGVSNYIEMVSGTDPYSADTDNDNLTDSVEIYTVLRTNVKFGTLATTFYEQEGLENKWVYYDRGGDNGFIVNASLGAEYPATSSNPRYYDAETSPNYANNYSYESTMSDITIEGFMNDTNRIYTLPDGAAYFLKSYEFEENGEIVDAESKLFLWTPGSDYYDLNGNNILEGTCYIFDFETYEDVITSGSNQPMRRFAYQEVLGGLDPNGSDSDGDSILDGDEGWDSTNGLYDTDGDGLINALDDDSDNDLLPDRMEATNISYDPREPDSDGDGLIDGHEWRWAIPSQQSNAVINPDRDGDGLPDGWIDGWTYNAETETWFKDENRIDGIPDPWEGEDLNLNGTQDRDETDPNRCDSDGDGIPDGIERLWDTAVRIDADSDSIPDQLISLVTFRTNNPDGFSEDTWIAINLTGFTIPETYLDLYAFDHTTEDMNASRNATDRLEIPFRTPDGYSIVIGKRHISNDTLYIVTHDINMTAVFYLDSDDYAPGDFGPNSTNYTYDLDNFASTNLSVIPNIDFFNSNNEIWVLDQDHDGIPNALDSDSDGDGLSDNREVRVLMRTDREKWGNYSDSWIALEINESTLQPEPQDLVVFSTGTFHADYDEPQNDQLAFTTPEGFDIYVTPSVQNPTNAVIMIDPVGEDTPAYVFENPAQDPAEAEKVNLPIPIFGRSFQEVIKFIDTDNDTIPDYLDDDSDNDGIPDGREDVNGNLFWDAQEETCWFLSDSDNDSIPDGIEPYPYSDIDGDGLMNALDSDSDGDGLPDGWVDDGDMVYEPGEGEDIDLDGVVDEGETSPLKSDSDGDGLSDSVEVYPGLFWKEAESLNNFQQSIESDSAAFYDEAGSLTETITIGYISEFSPQAGQGNYMFYIRARYEDGGTPLSGTPSVTFQVKKSSQLLTSKNVYLTDQYEWFSLGPFDTTDQANTHLKAVVTSLPENDLILLDTVGLIEMPDVESLSSSVTWTFSNSASHEETKQLSLTSFDYLPLYFTLSTLDVDVAQSDLEYQIKLDIGEDGINDFRANDVGDSIIFGAREALNSNLSSRDGPQPQSIDIALSFDSDQPTDATITLTLELLPLITHALFFDTDMDGLSDSIEFDHCSYPLDTDTDDDFLNDSIEVSIGTSPLKVDTDGDGLFDGFEDIDEDFTYDPGEEIGEDVDLDGIVDAMETNPLLYDTDMDGLSDFEETTPYVLWYEISELLSDEIEDHHHAISDDIFGMHVVGHEDGEKEIMDNYEIFLPSGDYMLMLLATTFGEDNKEIKLIINESSTSDTKLEETIELDAPYDDYLPLVWYSSSKFTAPNDGGFEITVLDKSDTNLEDSDWDIGLLSFAIVRIQTISYDIEDEIINPDDIDITYNSNQNAELVTLTIEIIQDLDMYVDKATFTLDLSYLTGIGDSVPALIIGDFVSPLPSDEFVLNNTQWSVTSGTPSTSTTLDLSGELMNYTNNNRDDISNGEIEIPLTFTENGTGVTGGDLTIISLSISLIPYITCPVYSDTDFDFFNDELETAFGTSSIKFDSDNDDLADIVELAPLIGTDPLDVDSDNDLSADGSLDELYVLYRTNVQTNISWSLEDIVDGVPQQLYNTSISRDVIDSRQTILKGVYDDYPYDGETDLSFIKVRALDTYDVAENTWAINHSIDIDLRNAYMTTEVSGAPMFMVSELTTWSIDWYNFESGFNLTLFDDSEGYIDYLPTTSHTIGISTSYNIFDYYDIMLEAGLVRRDYLGNYFIEWPSYSTVFDVVTQPGSYDQGYIMACRQIIDFYESFNMRPSIIDVESSNAHYGYIEDDLQQGSTPQKQTEIVPDQNVATDISNVYGKSLNYFETINFQSEPDLEYIKNLTLSICEGAQNDYDKAARIESHLRDNYYFVSHYEVSLELAINEMLDDYENTPLDFFFDHHIGNSSMFATAFVQMARFVDLPARYIQGYCVSPGENATGGQIFNITNLNPYDWAEVLFNTYGWIPFGSYRHLTNISVEEPEYQPHMLDGKLIKEGGTTITTYSQQNVSWGDFYFISDRAVLGEYAVMSYYLGSSIALYPMVAIELEEHGWAPIDDNDEDLDVYKYVRQRTVQQVIDLGAENTTLQTPECYEIWYRNDNGNKTVWIYVSEGDISVMCEFQYCDETDILPDSNRPSVPYALALKEQYKNSALENDLDKDGLVDSIDKIDNDADADDDGLIDGYEYYFLGTSIEEEDLDSDGRPDGYDSDGDGLSDGLELGLTMNDVVQKWWNFDASSWISQTDYSVFHPDRDPSSITDPLNRDTDGDGIIDGWEYRDGGIFGEDYNGNGRVDTENRYIETDPLLVDTDGDSLSDGTEWEGINYGYPWGISSSELNPIDIDTDDDGLADGESLHIVSETTGNFDMIGETVHGTDPHDADTDDDGIYDGTEVGMENAIRTLTKEAGYIIYATDVTKRNYKADKDTDTTTDPNDIDSDDDGVPDGYSSQYSRTIGEGSTIEYVYGEDKNRNGRFDDGELNPLDTDTDGDGIPDEIELDAHIDPRKSYGINGPHGDKDKDGISNIDEFEMDLDINDIDSDNDGMDDGWEFQYSLNPGNPDDANEDADSDDVTNLNEFQLGLIPIAPDSDYDNYYDGIECGQTSGSEAWAENAIGEYTGDYDLDDDGIINALDDDSDGDGLADLVEGMGWTVRTTQYDPPVVKEGDTPEDLKSNNVIITVEKYVYSNPTEPDSDNDGLLDGIEYSNLMDPSSDDTDGDQITGEGMSSDEFELTKYEEFLETVSSRANEYHPTIIDFISPEITIAYSDVFLTQKKTTETDGYTGSDDTNYIFLNCYFKVRFEVEDNAGVEEMSAYFVNTQEIADIGWTGMYHQAMWTVPITDAFYGGGDFDFLAYIYAIDYNGNPMIKPAAFEGVISNGERYITEIVTETNYDILDTIASGAKWAFETVLEIGGQIWDSVVDLVTHCGQVIVQAAADAANAIVEAVEAALEWLTDVLWEMIKTGIEVVVNFVWNGIQQALHNHLNGIYNSINVAIYEYSDTGEITSDTAFDVLDSILGGMLSACEPIVNTLNTIMSMLKPVLDAVSDIIDKAINAIIGAISGEDQHLSVTDSLDLGLDSVTEYGLNLIGVTHSTPFWFALFLQIAAAASTVFSKHFETEAGVILAGKMLIVAVSAWFAVLAAKTWIERGEQFEGPGTEGVRRIGYYTYYGGLFLSFILSFASAILAGKAMWGSPDQATLLIGGFAIGLAIINIYNISVELGWWGGIHLD